MANKLISELNSILANIHVLGIKLHNYHWNVSGIQFHSIHNMTEAYYDHFFKEFDDVAERILQLGEKPIATVKGYLEVATIKEDEGNKFDATYVLENVVSDFETLLADIKTANEIADEAGDVATGDMLSGLIVYLEKEIWLLKSTLGK